MLYKNITEETIGVERATGAISIRPGEEAAIAPVVAAPYVERKQLELVTATAEPDTKTSKRDRASTANTTSKSESDN